MAKASNGKNFFNEMTRVQMPALVHLTRLGYTYYGRIFEDMADEVYDQDTNILKDIFISQFKKLTSMCSPKRAFHSQIWNVKLMARLRLSIRSILCGISRCSQPLLSVKSSPRVSNRVSYGIPRAAVKQPPKNEIRPF